MTGISQMGTQNMSAENDFSHYTEPEPELVLILLPRKVVTRVLDSIPVSFEYRYFEYVYRIRSGSYNQFTTYYAKDCTYE